MALLTLSEGKEHLRIPQGEDDHNSDIVAKIDEASDLVVKHCNLTPDPGWNDGSAPVPGNVKAAACVVLTYLYERRGETMTVSADIWQAVERVLVATRVSAMA